MVITYYGISCFKIQSGDKTLVFDLPAKKSGIKPPRFHSDIVVQSHDYDGGEISPAGLDGQDSFLIDGPGEYEIKEVYIHGLKSFRDSVSGKKHGLNTVYIVRFENINLCFLGDFGEKELRSELKEEIGKVDILFVPIGGDAVLDAEVARNITSQIEPAIAIPMHYGNKGDVLKKFLSEMGQKDAKTLEKFSIKKKDIAENGTQVIVLSTV